MAVATGCTKSFAPSLIYPEFQTKLRWLGKHRQSSAKRTDEASRGGASSSDRRRNCPQDVPENAGLHLKRLGAVVLIVSRRHHDNEIEFRCPPRPSEPAQWISRPLSGERPSHHKYP